jgi:ribulose-phosphate 3-epimerase
MARRPVVSASILAADLANLGEAIRQAEAGGADWIHIDVMDGRFVPNLTMGPVVIEACRRTTSLPLDVHLMVHEPAPLFPALLQAGADRLTIHVEAVTHLHRQLAAIREAGAACGVALNPATPLSAVEEVLAKVDLVLAMTVDPGFSGQRFLEGVLDKVGRLRRALDDLGSSAHLQVDGGVDPHSAVLAARRGADCFVAAQAIFGHPQGAAAGARQLRAALEPAFAG